MSAVRAVWLAVLLAALTSAIVTYAVLRSGAGADVSCTATQDGRSVPCEMFAPTLPSDAGKWTGGRG